MRVVVDYRPALTARTGVGEYVHEAFRTFAEIYPQDRVTLFTSSWKDRPAASLAAEAGAHRIVDYRLPVRALNFAWHHLEWPAIERLAGEPFDVAFSPHPLLLPARRAAQVVMIHDLDFLRAPERTQREIRRDYPRLAGRHARRASQIIVPSEHTARDVVTNFGVPRERIAVCPPGAPRWCESRAPGAARDGYILFVGTLEPRKNIGGLLRAYARLVSRFPAAPRLVLAGRITPESAAWIAQTHEAPLAGRVDCLGYIPDVRRRDVYAGARVLVLPSFEEGFGIPVLEAMSLGIPVVASGRGALPEVAGDAALLIDPDDDASIAAALERLLCDDTLAARLASQGRDRAGAFRWTRTATLLRAAFESSIARHLRHPRHL